MTQKDYLKQLHDLRQKLDQSFAAQPASAYSVDGKTFSFEASLGKPFQTGDFLLVRTNDGREYLSQALGQDVYEKYGPEYGVSLSAKTNIWEVNQSSESNFKDRVTIPYLKGFGDILGRWTGNTFECTSNDDTFQNATVTLAPSDITEQFLLYQSGATGIEIGKAVHSEPKTRVYLRADGFNRHTFLCGQSGSGKTFSLGLILEQLLLHTDLPIIVMDPNSDFVQLDTMLRMTEVNSTRSLDLTPEQYDSLAEKHQTLKAQMRILRSREAIAASERKNESWSPLRIDFSGLHWSDQAALLRLDPLSDRDEYQSFQTIVNSFGNDRFTLHDLQEAIRKDFAESARHVGLRIQNLGIGEWRIWKHDDSQSLEDNLSDRPRLLVVDTGSLSLAEEQLAVALSVLIYLWRQRETRQPILLVADEAHNLCPQHPTTPPEQVTAEHFIRIAGEGRKFGIYQLLASQRPGKIHQNVLTQCENLILMKMNSRADLALMAELFSQIPSAFLDETAKFSLGQALISGRLVRTPTIVQFEGRLSKEGGADIPTIWATQE